MKTITEYEVIDHGFESSQYFQGCGTSGTEFTDVATGIGDTSREAMEDAREQLAQNDWDVMVVDFASKLNEPDESVSAWLDSFEELSQEDRENCDTYAYVSVRVK